ncbi:hypothetical protein ACE38V_09270 [Cytobacillus sp. Hz8]
MFGHYKELVCMFSPQSATHELPKGFSSKCRNVGMLTIDYTWKDF